MLAATYTALLVSPVAVEIDVEDSFGADYEASGEKMDADFFNGAPTARSQSLPSPGRHSVTMLGVVRVCLQTLRMTLTTRT